MKKPLILVVDDNDRYANNLIEYLKTLGCETIRAVDAAQGWSMYRANKNLLKAVITDITMETQTSGLWMIRNIHKDGFPGIKVIATTGFDVAGVMAISKYLLPWFAGIEYMVPKVPLKAGKVLLLPTKLGSATFEEKLKGF
ncbi:response regulator [Leptospira wolffii]|uniref:response regulator n=1 Tax=Leptospira wolffii TaxID=409998 RepID=UPI000345DBA6|nr:response regulator [Leptospira wolffii]TGK62192.1 response regulator [Leptospira wolffii]TGK66563.1 response regulator [Leptospira wolffii]TGK74424.1 response regulator [Leptospira wolffii]TGL32001.1 response regulator [Leptospira wolffii]